MSDLRNALAGLGSGPGRWSREEALRRERLGAAETRVRTLCGDVSSVAVLSAAPPYRHTDLRAEALEAASYLLSAAVPVSGVVRFLATDHTCMADAELWLDLHRVFSMPMIPLA
jgi:hypothetical protein